MSLRHRFLRGPAYEALKRQVALSKRLQENEESDTYTASSEADAYVTHLVLPQNLPRIQSWRATVGANPPSRAMAPAASLNGVETASASQTSICSCKCLSSLAGIRRSDL